MARTAWIPGHIHHASGTSRSRLRSSPDILANASLRFRVDWDGQCSLVQREDDTRRLSPRHVPGVEGNPKANGSSSDGSETLRFPHADRRTVPELVPAGLRGTSPQTAEDWLDGRECMHSIPCIMNVRVFAWQGPAAGRRLLGGAQTDRSGTSFTGLPRSTKSTQRAMATNKTTIRSRLVLDGRKVACDSRYTPDGTPSPSPRSPSTSRAPWTKDVGLMNRNEEIDASHFPHRRPADQHACLLSSLGAPTTALGRSHIRPLGPSRFAANLEVYL